MYRLRDKNFEDNSIVVEIDTVPTNFNPLNAKDYAEKMICSALFERLKDGVNCEIVVQNQLQFDVHLFDNYIGDAVELYNCVLFCLDRYNKNHNLKSFLAIKNAVGVIQGRVEYSELGIEMKGDRLLRITLDYHSPSFYYILQSPLFVPVRDKQPLNNGPYTLTEKTSEIITLSRNRKYDEVQNIYSTYVEKLIFKLNTNPERSVALYKEHHIDITCHTQFHHNHNHLKIYNDYEERESDLLFCLKVKNKDIKNFIVSQYPSQSLSIKLGHIIEPALSLVPSTLRPHSHNKEKCIPPSYVVRQKLKILYADYYPNCYVIEELIQLLDRIDIKYEITKVHDFNEYIQMEIERYDIVLQLFFPTYSHYSSYVRYFIQDIMDDASKKKIIELLNSDNYKGIVKTFEQTDHFIPLFYGRNQYFIDPQIEGYTLDRLGCLDVCRLHINRIEVKEG